MNQKQVNIRVEEPLYRALESIARKERRSVPQTVRLLLEEGMKSRCSPPVDDISGIEIAALMRAGGSFDWLNDEPDIYDDSCGEPV
jgi:hypothetical protein